MNKRILAIGGGQGKGRETLPPEKLAIDAYIAAEARKIAGDRRPCGLFIPTASHDCMPYYNTFHKVFTGKFDIKTDVALTVNRDLDMEKLKGKLERADFLYVGGGNTVFMLEQWKATGLLGLIRETYEREMFIVGLSAGGICWFEDMYSDSVIEGEYRMYKGLGWLKGKISPHYNERMLDFDEIVRYNRFCAWGIEDDAAVEFVNGEPVKTVSSGGKVWLLDGSGNELVKRELQRG